MTNKYLSVPILNFDIKNFFRLIWITPVVSVFLLFTACRQPDANQAFHPEPAGKLFIIGGGKRPPEMIRRMLDESGVLNAGYILILPMASEELDSAVFYARKQFAEQGFDNISYMVFDSATSLTETQLDSIKYASLVYITGGDQSRFMKAVLTNKAAESIRDCYTRGGMIAGTSAGAAVMSGKMITGNERKNPDYNETFRTIWAENLELGQGLGLAENVIVDQHFVRRSRHNRLITAVLEYPELTGIGIDEATAVLLRNKEFEVIGQSQVLVFSNPKKVSRRLGQDLLGGSLKLEVYLPGEKFRL